MRLTLPQQLYLLCYTVDKDKFEATNLQGRGQLLRAGAMAELASARLLSAEDGKVVQLPAKPPGDPFLAEVWHDLPTEKPKRWLNYLHNKADTAERPVRDQLDAAGVITAPRERRLWPLLASHYVTVHNPGEVKALQEKVRNITLLAPDPAEVSLDELTMAVFTSECEVTTLLSNKERREHKQARKALAARFDGIVPGLRAALRDSFLASRGVGGGWGK